MAAPTRPPPQGERGPTGCPTREHLELPPLPLGEGRGEGRGRIMLTNLRPHLVNRVTLGRHFALIALGFMLIVGVMETINLAHGSLFALGMYVALFPIAPSFGWFPELQSAYLALPLATRYAIALFAAPLVVGIFGMALELCMRRTYARDPLYGV